MPQPQSRTSGNPILRDFLRLAGIGTLLFLVTVSFTLLLSASMLFDLSRETRLSAYREVVEQLRIAIERGLRFGRPLDGYAGLEERLRGAIHLAGDLTGAAVVGADGAVIRAAGDMGAGFEAAADAVWSEFGGGHVLALPLAGRAGVQAGTLFFRADNAVIDGPYDVFLRRNVILILVLVVAVALSQSGWLYHVLSNRERDGKTRRNLYLVLLIFTGGGQLAFCVSAALSFSRTLAESDRVKVEMTGRVLASNLERLVEKGVTLAEVRGIAPHLAEVIASSPETAAIRVFENGRLAAEAGVPVDGGVCVMVPVESYRPGHSIPRPDAARIELWTDPARLNHSIRRLCLNMGTSMIISFLLLIELVRVFIAFSVRVQGAATRVFAAQPDGTSPDRLILSTRFLCFLFFCGYDMVLSFVPLAAASLPGSVWPFPDSLGGALPITAEQFMGGAGILAVGRVFSRWGFRHCVLVGLGSAVAGGLLAWVAPTIMTFVLSRALSGFGFGVLFMSCQLGLMARQVRAGGLAQMYSGIFSGGLCGVAAGAMASEFLGYQNVFGFSAVFLAGTMLLARIFPGPEAAAPLPAVAAGEQREARAKRRAYFLSTEFLSPLVLVTLPVATAMAGFLYLGVPTELNRIGVSQSDIGRLFMGYSLCFILFGPLFAGIADGKGKYHVWVALSGAANGLALLCASWWPSYGGFALAVLLQGLSHTLLSASAMVCVLSGPRARALDRNAVGSVYRLAERSGHIVGPLAFGLLLSGAGVGLGMPMLGAVFLAGSGAFLFVGGILYGKPRD